MYRELIYFENGKRIARVFSENNDHEDNGDIEAMFTQLKAKIAQKEQGNHKWNWKDELKRAYEESFPYLQPKKAEVK